MPIRPTGAGSARLAAITGIACATTALAACAATPGATASAPPEEEGPVSGYYKVLDDPRKEWPFKFEHHNFGVYCYDTVGCQVRYGGNFPHGARDENEADGPKPGDQEKTQLAWRGTRSAIKAFAGPVRARWKSLDGEQHDVEIDLNEVFPDKAVLHNVKFEELSERGAVGRPDIVIEVEDRTISVWTATTVPVKKLRDPNNPHSRYRYDWIKAWSRTL